MGFEITNSKNTIDNFDAIETINSIDNIQTLDCVPWPVFFIDESIPTKVREVPQDLTTC